MKFAVTRSICSNEHKLAWPSVQVRMAGLLFFHMRTLPSIEQRSDFFAAQDDGPLKMLVVKLAAANSLCT